MAGQITAGVTTVQQVAVDLRSCDSLARYKVPRTVDFRATLPRTDTGKLHKRLLREEYSAAAGQHL
jgi:acyl-CoA synthetase (AMP-forming)/AMP-acid ligase II